MPWRVWILWLLFLVRGAFFCAILPLWEGWDEYAHFAWLQHWVDQGTLPNLHDPVSKEIDESLRLAPLAYELRWIGNPYLTHAEWWALPEAERTERLRALRSMPAQWQHEPAAHRFAFYEAQQPPLYYWIASVPLRSVSGWPLARRVLLIRLLSLLLASFSILLLRNSAYAAALIAVAPGFLIDVSRVANDCLAVTLVALLLVLLPKRGWMVGLVLGAALLTKAYMLALIPALVLIWWKRRRDLAIALLIAAAIAGWWYARNVLLGYSLSGWLVQGTTAQLAGGIFEINWLSAANVVAKSFLWFGAWSFLTLKSWMYTALELAAAAACILAFRRRSEDLGAPAMLTAVYLAAMAYGVLAYWSAQHVPNLPGWYLWPMAAPMAMILVAGLRSWSKVLIAALAAVDIYGITALLAPYYAGLTERNRAAGGQFFAALTRFHTPVWLAAAWLLATAGIVAIACMTNYDSDHRSRRNPPSL